MMAKRLHLTHTCAIVSSCLTYTFVNYYNDLGGILFSLLSFRGRTWDQTSYPEKRALRIRRRDSHVWNTRNWKHQKLPPQQCTAVRDSTQEQPSEKSWHQCSWQRTDNSQTIFITWWQNKTETDCSKTYHEWACASTRACRLRQRCTVRKKSELFSIAIAKRLKDGEQVRIAKVLFRQWPVDK